jgi:hypothetical protein
MGNIGDPEREIWYPKNPFPLTTPLTTITVERVGGFGMVNIYKFINI